MVITKELIVETISDLKSYLNTEFVIGGSASLVMYGLIDREIHDIDVFCYSNEDLLNRFDCSDLRKSQQFEYRQSLIKDLRVDLFLIQNGSIRYFDFNWNGLSVKLMNPYQTFYAKTLSYNKKHLQDLDSIRKVKDLSLGEELILCNSRRS